MRYADKAPFANDLMRSDGVPFTPEEDRKLVELRGRREWIAVKMQDVLKYADIRPFPDRPLWWFKPLPWYPEDVEPESELLKTKREVNYPHKEGTDYHVMAGWLERKTGNEQVQLVGQEKMKVRGETSPTGDPKVLAVTHQGDLALPFGEQLALPHEYERLFRLEVQESGLLLAERILSRFSDGEPSEFVE